MQMLHHLKSELAEADQQINLCLSSAAHSFHALQVPLFHTCLVNNDFQLSSQWNHLHDQQ